MAPARVSPTRPRFAVRSALAWLALASLLSACSRTDPAADKNPAPSPEASTVPSASIDPFATAADSTAPPPASAAVADDDPLCPQEMVFVPGPKPFCIDRWEAILVDKNTGNRLSPYYPADRKLAARLAGQWESKRGSVGTDEGKAIAVPPLSAWQRDTDAEPMAVSKPGETPNGYMSGKVALQACENAGKRLCKHDEWVRACRGRADRQFPYGDKHEQGKCNMFRSTHPGAVLHDDVTTGHLDPRMNLVKDKQGPLLRRTGETRSCRSEWGEDAVHDMVGNLDEWVDDPEGTFVGGFFSRSKKDGCSSIVKNHPFNYFDYSLGVRCCRDAGK